jgi:hypothetical protein
MYHQAVNYRLLKSALINKLIQNISDTKTLKLLRNKGLPLKKPTF